MQFNENSDNNKNVNNFNDNRSVNNEVQRITDISLRETSKLGLDQEMNILDCHPLPFFALLKRYSSIILNHEIL